EARFFPAAVVTGTVAAAVEQTVTVAAFRVDREAARAGLVDQASCAPGSAFRLRLWPDEEQWVVVVAPGLAPRGVRVRPALAAPTNVGDIVLDAGLAVSGSVSEESGLPLVADAREPGRVLAVGPLAAMPLPLGDFDVGVDGDAVVLR